jgi:hypothetical protein
VLLQQAKELQVYSLSEDEANGAEDADIDILTKELLTERDELSECLTST